jgi:hypothetical protein
MTLRRRAGALTMLLVMVLFAPHPRTLAPSTRLISLVPAVTEMLFALGAAMTSWACRAMTAIR